MNTSDLVQALREGILSGDTSSLAKAITLAESRRSDHQAQFQELLRGLPSPAQPSLRIGITGLPGAGKSTFIEAIGQEILRENHRLAVLTVDPSSPLHKGSILGDKTRMPTLAADPRVFIRPSPSSGYLGGVTATTYEVIQLCEAAGFDTILIESVGIGQSEMTIASVSDLLVLLMIAGAGDELQGIKSGILEVADLVAINKAEGEHRQAAEQTLQEYQQAFGLRSPHSTGLPRLTALCSALTGEGIRELWIWIQTRVKQLRESDAFQKRRSDQKITLFEDAVRKQLEFAFRHDDQVQEMMKQAKTALKNGESSIEELASAVVKVFGRPNASRR